MKPRRRLEEDLARDIQEHIAMATRENIERGLAPDEARLAALRKFGSVARATEETYAVWHWMALERLRQDVRYALRGLRRNPAFAAVAVFTLALGIGMNTAVFSVVNAVLLRPLPYPDASRLVWLAEYHPRFKMEAVAGPDYFDWKERAHSFDKMACYGYGGKTLGTGADSDQVGMANVSEDFLSMAGARPEVGRLFGPGDRSALLLSHRLFVRKFGGDPAVIGKTVTVDSRPFVIIGVLPEGFRFAVPTDLPGADSRDVEAYIPDSTTREGQVRGQRMSILHVIGRLKPGIPVSAAAAEIGAIQAGIANEDRSGFYKGVQLRVLPLQERLVGGARRALVVLLAAVGLVLLIACVNIANLLLARATTRQREIAIRAAIGAGRGRMIAQLMAEGVVLAFAGGAAGLLVSRLALGAMVRMGAHAVPRLGETSIDLRVLGFTLVLSCLTGILFGMGPALSLSRASLADVLKDGGRSLSGGAPALSARRLLMAGELALAVVLLIGAGLLVRSFWRMNAHPAGFAPERIATMKVSLAGPAYRERPAQLAYFDDVLHRVTGAPGIAAAGLSNTGLRGFIEVEGIQFPPNQAPQTIFHTVSSGYFRVMGTRLIAGRWLTDAETGPVVMINEAFARRVFGNANPLGRRFRTGSAGMNINESGASMPRNVMAEIVGVVADLRSTQLDAEPGPEAYIPYRESTSLRAMDVMLRAAGDPFAAAASARKLVAAIDPSQPVYDVQTLEQVLSDSVAPRRFNLMLLGVFALAALVLAVVGIYGVMSYAVTQRNHEIGVRMALGAGKSEVIRLVVRQGMVVAGAGMAVGIGAALALTRLMRSMLYEVSPEDPWTFGTVCAILAAAVLAASWLPARRAAAVDPTVALRYE